MRIAPLYGRAKLLYRCRALASQPLSPNDRAKVALAKAMMSSVIKFKEFGSLLRPESLYCNSGERLKGDR